MPAQLQYLLLCNSCGKDFRSENPRARYCAFCPPLQTLLQPNILCVNCGRPTSGGVVCSICGEA